MLTRLPNKPPDELSEAKIALHALRESEAALRGFMDSATDSFAIFDRDLRFLELNEVAARRLGHDRSEIIGEDIAGISLSCIPTGRYDKYKEVLRTGVPYLFEMSHVRPPTGAVVQLAGTAFRIGQDRLGLAIHDVTDRARVEEALRKTEANLSDLVAAASDRIWELDAELRTVSYRGGGPEQAGGNSIGLGIGEIPGVDQDSEHFRELEGHLKAHRQFRDARLTRDDGMGGDAAPGACPASPCSIRPAISPGTAACRLTKQRRSRKPKRCVGARKCCAGSWTPPWTGFSFSMPT